MKAIINSSPLIALGCINKVDILTKLFSEVLIPQEVYNETVINGKNTEILNAIRACKKFKVLSATNIVLLEFLNDHLDKGESEDIVLAKEIGITTVIIDEVKGRNIAKLHGLDVIGSLGILLIAKKRGLISGIREYIDQMEDYGIRIGNDLKQQVLQMVGE